MFLTRLVTMTMTSIININLFNVLISSTILAMLFHAQHLNQSCQESVLTNQKCPVHVGTN